ncbi:competence protein ComE [Waterburya agarophytonicola K14]|uniref:phospholipase D n=2 Tax=Waterburya TaxID=2886915 RepID=A0A964BSY1_9CYAN|nr:phospholipase D-like domain-containing protein [Waterburya agarophytonicola]MCC0177953.1 competence protein ComE [Waterburya agarophytonicola KI4]
MYRLTWIFLLCLIVITGCKNSSKRLSDLSQDEFIQGYFNHRETGTETYLDPYRKIERGGDNLEGIIIESITAANSTVDLAVQELNLPLIALALVKSHRSGVKVRVILDNNYSRALSSLKPQEIKQLNQRDRLKYDEFISLVDRDNNGRLSTSEKNNWDALVILHNAGIPMIDDTADGSKGSGLMHHKFVVIDRQTVVTGSSNFTLSGIHGDFSNLDSRGNVNHLLRINNREVADLFVEEFNYMWGSAEAGGINSKFGLAKPSRSPESIIGNNTKFTVQFSPISPTKDWHLSSNGLIAKVINNANNSIDLALFVFSDGLIAKKLQQKQKEGVSISGVFDSGFAFRYYSEVLDLLGISLYYRCQAEADNNPWTKPLKNIGVANIARGDKLHHKFALIDKQTIISGSQNWSQAANHQNDEATIVINNLTLAQHFDREYQRLSQSAFWGLPDKIKTKAQQQQQDCQ